MNASEKKVKKFLGASRETFDKRKRSSRRVLPENWYDQSKSELQAFTICLAPFKTDVESENSVAEEAASVAT